MSLDGRLEVFLGRRRGGGAGTGHHKRLDSTAVIEAGAATGRRDFGSDLTKRSSVFCRKLLDWAFPPSFVLQSIPLWQLQAVTSLFSVKKKMKRKKEEKTLKSSTL